MSAKIKRTKPYSGYKHPHKPRGISASAFQRSYWPYLPLLIMIGGLLAFAIDSGAFSKLPEQAPSANIMSDAELVIETNKQRTTNNLEPLKFNQKLDRAAQAKADDMAERNYWSHTAPDGKLPWGFADDVGYSYQKIGENLAAGFWDEKSSVAGWMASSSHRQNLMDSAYSDVGFGAAYNVDYKAAGGGPKVVVVAMYGRPENALVAGKTLGISSQKLQTSHAQIAMVKYNLAGVATFAAFCLLIGAIMFWAYRHALALHRVIIKGESYAIRHPLVDIGLLIIAALAYVLSRSAGMVL